MFSFVARVKKSFPPYDYFPFFPPFLRTRSIVPTSVKKKLDRLLRLPISFSPSSIRFQPKAFLLSLVPFLSGWLTLFFS